MPFLRAGLGAEGAKCLCVLDALNKVVLAEGMEAGGIDVEAAGSQLDLRMQSMRTSATPGSPDRKCTPIAVGTPLRRTLFRSRV
jgi:hypothetical protein